MLPTRYVPVNWCGLSGSVTRANIGPLFHFVVPIRDLCRFPVRILHHSVVAYYEHPICFRCHQPGL